RDQIQTLEGDRLLADVATAEGLRIVSQARESLLDHAELLARATGEERSVLAADDIRGAIGEIAAQLEILDIDQLLQRGRGTKHSCPFPEQLTLKQGDLLLAQVGRADRSTSCGNAPRRRRCLPHSSLDARR